MVEHVSYVYSCRRCEREEVSTPVITAPAPEPPLPGSIASPSAIAYIMTGKYVDGLPLYRQEKSLSRLGIELSRQTMANWMIKASECWLEPLYQRLHEILLKRNILHSDETTLQVLREDGREATSKSFMWLYRTGEESAIVLYDYQTTRRASIPSASWKDSKATCTLTVITATTDCPALPWLAAGLMRGANLPKL